MLTCYQLSDNHEGAMVEIDGLAQFVRDVRARKGLDQKTIRDRGGPSTGWLGSLEAGTRTDTPKPDTLRRLAKGLGVEEFEVFAAAGLLDLAAPKGPLTRALEDLAPKTPIPEADVAVPYGGEVGCGGRVELDPTATLEVPRSLASKGDFVLTARGSSMTKAGIKDGDLLFIRRQRKANHNQVVLAQLADDGATVKKLKISNPKVNPKGWLVAESYTEEHDPVPVDSTVHILGVVTYVQPKGFSLE